MHGQQNIKFSSSFIQIFTPLQINRSMTLYPTSAGNLFLTTARTFWLLYVRHTYTSNLHMYIVSVMFQYC